MGESFQNFRHFHVDPSLRLESHRAKETGKAGFLAYRELDGALGLIALRPG